MDRFDLYEDISNRTNGNIYIGVVGPVRTGKSTFVSKFMEKMVLPNIESSAKKQRATDELPQSADGKTIMTTEPKFVPNEAVSISFKENQNVNVRLIDCVGYLVKGAIGHVENDKPRMVRTPWSDKEMPFEKAGEIGTQKVISEHSTIGVVVTTDGSITDIAREDYISAEERVVRELKALGKPFVIVINSKNPASETAQNLKSALSAKYNNTVMAMNLMTAEKEDLENLLQAVLLEFPVRLIEANLPKWLQALDPDSEIISTIIKELETIAKDISVMKDYEKLSAAFAASGKINAPDKISVDLSSGGIVVELSANPKLLYDVISKESNKIIDDDFKLLAYIKSLKNAEVQYDSFKKALESVEQTGYGVVTPTVGQMTLEEPAIVKQGGRFGVKLRASAPSLHIMKVDVQTEVNPIVGSEQQGEDLVKYLLAEFENNKNGIWETNMFGKPLSSLVKEGLNSKLTTVPPEIFLKMRKTMSRIVNEGKGGVLCILL